MIWFRISTEIDRVYGNDSILIDASANPEGCSGLIANIMHFPILFGRLLARNCLPFSLPLGSVIVGPHVARGVQLTRLRSWNVEMCLLSTPLARYLHLSSVSPGSLLQMNNVGCISRAVLTNWVLQWLWLSPSCCCRSVGALVVQLVQLCNLSSVPVTVLNKFGEVHRIEDDNQVIQSAICHPPLKFYLSSA